MKVLVIEDDSSVRETLGMVLEACNHQADLIDTGEQALEYLKTRWPDVVLLDLTLPGMSGEEVYHRIRNNFGRVPPTVVITAVQYGAQRAEKLEGAYFLAKPYTIEQLENVLCEAAESTKGAAAGIIRKGAA